MGNSTIGSRIKAERKSAGLTQAELATKLGTSTAMVGQWETNIRNPRAETLENIALALNVSVDRLRYETVIKKVIVPERAWIIEIDDPTLNNHIFRIEATDQEAFEYVQNIMAEAAGDIFMLTPEARIVKALNQLNDIGKAVAVERIEELTKISDYQDDKK